MVLHGSTCMLSLVYFPYILRYCKQENGFIMIVGWFMKVCFTVLLSGGSGVMLFKATFNNISVILCRSVLLVEETRVPGENHRPVASHWQTLSHNSYRLSGIQIHNVSGDRYWLQLPYDQDHDGLQMNFKNTHCQHFKKGMCMKN